MASKNVLGDDPFEPKSKVKAKPGKAGRTAAARAPVAKKPEPASPTPATPVETAPNATTSPATGVDPTPPQRGPEPVVVPAPHGASPEDLPIVEAQPVAPAESPELERRIRDLDAQIDALMARVRESGADSAEVEEAAERLRSSILPGPGEAPAPAPERRDEGVFDVAREMLASNYYARQWGRVAMRDRSEEVDEFGLDPKYAERTRPVLDALYSRWWRVETDGVENVPADGRVILCANHSGALPFDGAMLATAIRREHPSHRQLRWLAEDFIFGFPFVGVSMNRIGAVRACQENAERLLQRDACVAVFPEGVKGVSKPYKERYKLQRFGRGGHVKLAIRTRTPIVPVAILGAEEAFPMLAATEALGKPFGLPYLPLTPTFPLLGPAGLMPLPTKWRIHFLEPLTFDGYAANAAEDEVLVGRINEKIRGLIQERLDTLLRNRRSIWRG